MAPKIRKDLNIPEATQLAARSILGRALKALESGWLAQSRYLAGPQLTLADFAAYARAFGGHGETVERTADFEAAFERALAAGKPSIIHVKTDAEAITSRITMTKLREQALAKQKQ